MANTLARASAAVAELVGAARQAAVECPACSSLADALAEEAARELASLRSAQARALTADAEVVVAKAGKLGLSAALGRDLLVTVLQGGNALPDVAPASLTAVPPLPLGSPYEGIPSACAAPHQQKAFVAKFFGDVATQMRSTVDEIRARRAASLPPSATW